MTGAIWAGVAFGAALLGAAQLSGIYSPGAGSALEICRPGYARSQRLHGDAYYAMAMQAYARAGIPYNERHGHIIDHIVPICLGGSNDLSNIQIQTRVAAGVKDALEWRACRDVCAGRIRLDAARAQFRRSVP